MRVLEVARQFYPRVGGIESCVLNLTLGLAARGHHVEVVTLDRDLRDGHPIRSPASLDGVPIHRVPYFGSRRYTVAPAWLRFAAGFDVVHLHGIDFFIDFAALARTLGVLRQPIVVTTHGGIFHTPDWHGLKAFYWRTVVKRSLTAAETVVAVSEGDVKLFAPIVPATKLVTIPNGVDPIFREASRERHPRHSRRTIVTFGRVSASKSIDRIVALFAAVAADFPDVDLVIAGPEENGTTGKLRRLCNALGLDDRVHFPGPLPAGRLAAVVAEADVFVSAAPHEGFGITTVEALSAGVPVLVTHTGIHDQLVKPAINGWFWSGSPDPDAVTTLREALLLADARVEEMRRAARDSAAPFDWSLSTDRYERVLEGAYRKSPG
jgi:alpha-1,3-mannosyltransferase